MNVGDEVKIVGKITRVFPINIHGKIIAEVLFEGTNGPEQVNAARLALNDNPADWQEDLA